VARALAQAIDLFERYSGHIFMRIFYLVVTFVVLYSSVHASDRPSAALRLFEQYCLPIVYSKSVLPRPSNELLTEQTITQPSNGTKARQWTQGPTDVELVIYDKGDGLVSCSVSDEPSPFNSDEREQFDALVSDWVPSRLPMLTYSEGDGTSSSKIYKWLQFKHPDPRRWGVLLMRFGEGLNYGTNLVLALAPQSPRF
jgi:hypothetical protein